MPPVIAALPLIASIASLAGTGVGLGLELSNQPGNPKPPTTSPAATALQNTTTQNAIKESVSQQTPDIIGATSGLANPEYIASIVQLLAGTAGTSGSRGAAGQAVASAFGLPGLSPGTQGTSGSNFVPAGANQPNPAPGAPTNLSDFVSQFLYR